MALYKEETATGAIVAWNRALRTILDNPMDGLPSVMVYETQAKRYPDGSSTETPVASHQYTATDPLISIPFIDENYEPTENTFTVGEFQHMAASMMLWLMRGGE